MHSAGPLSPLNPESSALLVDSGGAPEFGPALLEIAHSTAAAVELFAYLVVENTEPTVLVSHSQLLGVERRVSEYVDRFYRHDPAVHRIWSAQPGESFKQRIKIQGIVPHDYRRICFGDPGFDEKLSFGWRGQDYIIVLSFYRRDDAQSSGLNRLASLASLTLAILVRHYAPIGRYNVIELVERRLRRSFPSLSTREVEVCARTLLGWSAATIGESLAISAGTALTYRRRAYDKTDHVKIADFLPALLS